MTTHRLTLRGFRQSDLDAYAVIQSDIEVMRHLGVGAGAGRTRTRDETWTSMAVMSGQWLLKGYGTFAVEQRETGRFIGRAGILDLAGWPEPELAYQFSRDVWGTGMAGEACAAILPWAFRATGAERLVSYIKPGNTPSERLAARLGAVHEGPFTFMGVECSLWVHRQAAFAFA